MAYTNSYHTSVKFSKTVLLGFFLFSFADIMVCFQPSRKVRHNLAAPLAALDGGLSSVGRVVTLAQTFIDFSFIRPVRLDRWRHHRVSSPPPAISPRLIEFICNSKMCKLYQRRIPVGEPTRVLLYIFWCAV